MPSPVAVVGYVVRAGALSAVVATIARRPIAYPRPSIGRAGDATSTTVSVVVPARNEADRIRPLLEALADLAAADPRVAEVIVVDDGSSDATAAVVADHRIGVDVHVVTIDAAACSVPNRKANAVERGIAVARGEWIVTLDADTRPGRDLLAATVDRAFAHRLDLVSVAGSFAPATVGVAVCHPSLLTTLVYRFGRPGAIEVTRRVLANGQCLAFRRQWWVDRDGFGCAADVVAEDVALARAVVAAGDRFAFVDDPDALVVDPYRSARHTLSGWGRSIGLAGITSVAGRVGDVGVLAVLAGVPLRVAARRRIDLVDVAVIAVRLGTLVGTRRAYRLTGWRQRFAYWLSPVADPLAVALVTFGGRRRSGHR